ncbi:hypothetical protein [Chromatium okenii]|uniref:hypothetical protein n=1 Tax=Chromatium okenii TaxID=61644 RepID=UPI001905503F|nr:hypothetical protein [Chromatium okenii]
MISLLESNGSALLVAARQPSNDSLARCANAVPTGIKQTVLAALVPRVCHTYQCKFKHCQCQYRLLCETILMTV